MRTTLVEPVSSKLLLTSPISNACKRRHPSQFADNEYEWYSQIECSYDMIDSNDPKNPAATLAIGIPEEVVLPGTSTRERSKIS
jgi:hypothetical protein